MEALCDIAQHLFEGRPAETWLPGVIGAGPEGFAFWRQKGIQRPAAALAHDDRNPLQPVVDVRALFAINLYTDIKVVHQRCGFGVFEALMGHDMAPVAGGVPY